MWGEGAVSSLAPLSYVEAKGQREKLRSKAAGKYAQVRGLPDVMHAYFEKSRSGQARRDLP